MHFCIVKKHPTLSSYLPLIIVLVLTAAISFLSASSFTYIPYFVLAAGIGVCLYMAPMCLKTEYEYIIEGDLFSIALIKNKSSRKELFSCEITHLVSCAPYDERDMSVNVKTNINASSSENTLYYAVFSEDEKVCGITFSPSEDFIKELRLLAPRKVKINILN